MVLSPEGSDNPRQASCNCSDDADFMKLLFMFENVKTRGKSYENKAMNVCDSLMEKYSPSTMNYLPARVLSRKRRKFTEL